MTDSNNKNNPEWLYRHYQENRDNISPSVYNALRKKLEDEQHESSIYAITQLAKTAAYSSEEQTPKKAKVGWFSRTIAKITNPSPQFGMVAACLAIVAVIAPFGFSINTSSSFSTASHLSDCAECINYARNASVTTRGAAASSLGLDYRQAAKLGKLSGKLHALAAHDSGQALKIALSDLNKFPASTLTEGLTALKSESNPSLKQLDKELQNASANSNVFEASKTLFIANVTTRHALNTGISEGLSDSIDAAVKALNSLENRSLEQNRRIKTLESYKTKPADKQLIRTIEYITSTLSS